jgi:hypothetical protein
MAKRKVANIDDDLIFVKKRNMFADYKNCCITCLEMTGTLDGLRALVQDGYEHHNWEEHRQSARYCEICVHIWEVLEGDWPDVYDKSVPMLVYAEISDTASSIQKLNLDHPLRGSQIENLVFTLPESMGSISLGLVVLEGA